MKACVHLEPQNLIGAISPLNQYLQHSAPTLSYATACHMPMPLHSQYQYAHQPCNSIFFLRVSTCHSGMFPRLLSMQGRGACALPPGLCCSMAVRRGGRPRGQKLPGTESWCFSWKVQHQSSAYSSAHVRVWHTSLHEQQDAVRRPQMRKLNTRLRQARLASASSYSCRFMYIRVCYSRVVSSLTVFCFRVSTLDKQTG